jgi:hypothetical protein
LQKFVSLLNILAVNYGAYAQVFWDLDQPSSLSPSLWASKSASAISSYMLYQSVMNFSSMHRSGASGPLVLEHQNQRSVCLNTMIQG